MKRDQYFIQNGKSPRNVILRGMLNLISKEVDDIDVRFNDASDERKLVLMYVLGEVFHIDNDSKTKFKRKKSNRPIKPKVTIDDLLQVMNIDNNELEKIKTQCDSSMTLYDNYKKDMSMHGTLHWRIHSKEHECMVMNDTNPETGEFMVTIHYEVKLDTMRFTSNEICFV